MVVAQGGGKVRAYHKHLFRMELPHDTYLLYIYKIYLLCSQALLPLVSESTDVGKIKAAQALAKITITSNPEIAFPGERVRQDQLLFKLKGNINIINRVFTY